jgi:WD40 repeat protein
MHAKSVTSLAFSPDGQSVLSGAADGTIVLWHLASGRARRSFVGHGNMLTSLAFHRDGKTALSGSWDGTLRVWRLE